MSVEITERWLMDAGGWQAMKAARAAWQTGAVLAVEFDGTRLRGQVRSGGRTLAAGLIVKSRTDVTNLCGCPHSRREGALCEHSLALGLAWVHRGEAGKAPTREGTVVAAAGSSTHAGARAEIPKITPGRSSATPAAAAPPPTSGALCVSLPPTFFAGLRRNRLALSLKPAPASSPEAPADHAIHSWLALQGLATVPPQLALADRAQIESFLCTLAGHPRITVAGRPFTIAQDGWRLPIHIVDRRENGHSLPAAKHLSAHANEVSDFSHKTLRRPEDSGTSTDLPLEIDPSLQTSIQWWAGTTRGIVYFENLQRLYIINRLEYVSPFFDESGRCRPHAVSLAWLARHGSELSEVIEIDESDPRWPTVRVVPGRPRFRVVLDGTRRRLTARLWCEYEGVAGYSLPRGPLHPDPFPRPDPLEPEVFHDRNMAAESSAVARMTRAGFTFDTGDNLMVLNSESAVLQFFAGELAILETAWTVEYEGRGRDAFQGLERLTPQFREVAAGHDWLAFDLAFVGSAGSSLSAADARRWLQTGQGSRRLPNGKLAVLAQEAFEDLEAVLRDLDPTQDQGHFKVDRSQRGYLEASVARAGGESPSPEKIDFHKQLLSKEWHTLLRPYQREGARWMLGLAESGWGGILADEMGLGKTVQTLAVVATPPRAPTAISTPHAPCLVVAPTSLLGNWRDEAARFAPELTVLVVRSGERAQELARLNSADLVITSYQLLVRDIDRHREVVYRAVFLDEAGFIRNSDTQTARAVRQLRTTARFALTGTPIENSIRDLWSIMDFVLPGYLGRRDDFRERYEAPITAGDSAALRRLRRRMAPYWLRRLKQDVARDLPAKIEKIVRCELTPTQRDIYAAIHREGVRKVEEARHAHTTAQTRFTILTALLRLRQTCGDPRLLGESFPDRDPADFSGKWAVLTELLEEIRDGGHSVLIFSQFATQLRLLEPALAQAGLDFCRLDGASRDREAQVAAFRDNPAKRAFLISLKAGGFGLNLTKADTVIHFDPWWNPAVEAQATDRAHRIGQARPVTIYKLIAANTVEEKILALQHRKRQLMETALADDDTPMMDALDDEALHELLQT